jgi:toxin ParE1/3/4
MATFRLGALAEADIVSILARTDDRFGEGARQRYEILLMISLRDITSDPGRLASSSRPDIGPMVRSYHLRHSRDRARAIGGFVRQPRHLLLYRAITPGIIGVGRVLHDAMEVERHLPTDYGDG